MRIEGNPCNICGGIRPDAGDCFIKLKGEPDLEEFCCRDCAAAYDRWRKGSKKDFPFNRRNLPHSQKDIFPDEPNASEILKAVKKL